MKKRRRARDPDIRGVGPALMRAAKVARRIAVATNTPLVIWEDGKVVKKWLKRGDI